MVTLSNPLRKLEELGQSIWIDFIRRGMISSGELRRLIEDDGVSGVTSNPSIFEKAIVDSHDYDSAIRSMAIAGKNIKEIYEILAVEDIQSVADLLHATYDRLQGADGFVSLEVSPKLAHDTYGTIVEARHLWTEVNRPNAFIKVPATSDGLPAIQQLISEGINVNITLLFGLPRYRQVAEAYIAGLESRAAQGKSVKQIASVASFFLSRIDTVLDPLMEKLFSSDEKKTDIAKKAHGQVAIASAKAAYQIYKEIFSSTRFKKLVDQGVRAQRLLWASTSTKNPDYNDIKYIESLIGADTINTVPLETINAYRDHGDPKSRLEQEVKEAADIMEQLPELGISIDKVTQQLEDEGIKKFNESFDKLMEALTKKISV
ncbi:MAG: transaldolase [Bacteroidota bacterium]